MLGPALQPVIQAGYVFNPKELHLFEVVTLLFNSTRARRR
jgi:hypothetical protein